MLSYYHSVNSFDDLLRVNVDFLNNKIHRTYYYNGPFGDCLDHVDRRTLLIKLHEKYRIYTINGQSSLDDSTTQQTSYLEFIVEYSRGYRLAPLLLQDDRLYTAIYHQESKTDSFPISPYTLTTENLRPFSRWQRQHDLLTNLQTES